MKTIPFTAMNSLKFLSRLLLCILVISGLTACGGGGGGGGKGEYHLTGYSGVNPDDTANPYDLFVEFPWFVNFTFQVRNPECEGVSGLTADDFLVTEDGAEVSSADTEMRVHQRHTLPSGYSYTLDTVLLLDNTPSQSGNLDLIKQAAQAFIDSMDERRQQRVAIVAFNDNGDPFVKQGFTSNLSALNQCLITGEATNQNQNALQPSQGTTDFYGAVIKGLSLWEDDPSPDGRKFRQGVLVAITDGKDTSNLYSLNDVLAQRGRKQIFTVGVDAENIPENIQAELETLGKAGYFPVTEPEREADEGFDEKENLNETLQEIQNQILCFADGFYWLKYKSPSTSADANLNHTVNISIVDNKNTDEDSDITGEFSSSDFFTGIDGVYLNASSADPDGLSKLNISINEGDTNVTRKLSASSIADEKENASQFVWTSSDESVFTVETRGSNNETGIIRVRGDGRATLTVVDTANSNLSTSINIVISINMDSYEIISHPIDWKGPWFVDAPFEVRKSSKCSWVTDLISEDFSVYENGVLVDAEDAEINIRKRDALPSDFSYVLKTVLLIDNTPSIGSNNLQLVKDAAKLFVTQALQENPLTDANNKLQTQIAIWTFTEAGDSASLWQDFTSDSEKLKSAIDNIPAGFGSTNFYGGMIDALNLWQNDYNIWQSANKRLLQGVLVAITDGDHSMTGFFNKEAVLNEMAGKQVVTVGVGDDLISGVNEDLQEFGNAGFYSVPRPGQERVIGKDANGENITETKLESVARQIYSCIVDYANSLYWLEYKSGVSPAINCADRETLKIEINNNANTGADASVHGTFESCEFFTPQKDKIYLNSTASNPAGVKGPIQLRFDTGGLFFENPKYEIKAVTYDPTNMSNYAWDIVSGNNIIIDVDTKSYANFRATVKLNPNNRVPGPAWVKVEDKPNNSWTQIKFELEEINIPKPIAYYPFSGNANDYTGNGYHGQFFNASLTVDRKGRAGKAAHFNGSGSYVAINNLFFGEESGAYNDRLNELTVGAWIKTTSDKEQSFVSFDASEYFRLGMYDGTIRWYTSNTDENWHATAVSPRKYNDGTWHYICGTFDQSQQLKKLYVDGILVKVVSTDSKPVGSGNVRYGFIGAGSEAEVYNGDKNDPLYSDATVDEVMIFDTVLTEDAIKILSQN